MVDLPGRPDSTVGSLSAGCIEEEVACVRGKFYENGVSTIISLTTRRRWLHGKSTSSSSAISEIFLFEFAENLIARRNVGRDKFLKEGERELAVRSQGFQHFATREVHALIQEIHSAIRLWFSGKPTDSAASTGYPMLGWKAIEM